MNGLHILILLVYVAGGLLTTAALVADLQEITNNNPKDYRGNLAMAVFFGFVLLPPISWFLTFFLTGFYEHGFQLRRPR